MRTETCQLRLDSVIDELFVNSHACDHVTFVGDVVKDVDEEVPLFFVFCAFEVQTCLAHDGRAGRASRAAPIVMLVEHFEGEGDPLGVDRLERRVVLVHIGGDLLFAVFEERRDGAATKSIAKRFVVLGISKDVASEIYDLHAGY